MIHRLILLSGKQDLRLESGQLKSGDQSIAVDTLGSIQCLADCFGRSMFKTC